MVVNGRPSKRLVKRRVTAELSDFLTFPISGDSDVPPATKPFRTNVREFLDARALFPPPSSLFPHLVAWRIPFRVGDLVADDGGPAVVCLDVVEEDVSRSRSPYCDQCRVVGWSGNPVSAKRYHFIINGDGDSIIGSNKPCAACGDSLHMADPRCKSCYRATTTEDVEDWVYQQLDSTIHLLHGVIHSNGYGHLLRVNGREGGSNVLSGRQILNFWDRLCGVLGVRKVSVMDVSKKNGIEFRLLHAITNGHPWYGEWGYEFGAGSFGYTISDYNAAVAYLSSLPLSSFQARGRKPQSHLHDLIVFYQSISDRDLVSVRDLFCFMTASIRRSRESLPEADDDSPRKKRRTWHNPEASNTWNTEDKRIVNAVIFKVLRAVSGSAWVSWRALKGAVCRLGAPELLDHCLKEIGGKQAAPGWVVGSRISNSGAIEYRLEPGIESSKLDTSLDVVRLATSYLTEERLLRDLKYFYGSMLHPETMVAAHGFGAVSDFLSASARRILDCKQFVKDFRLEKADSKENNAVHILCEIDLVEASDLDPPPPELLWLSPDATVADLKVEATAAFREVYLMFRRFRAVEIVGYGGVDDSTQLKLLFGSSGSVRIRGKFAWKNSSSVGRYRLERGVERWVVDCSCGAKDDDGERMLACDGCSIWLHTRCAGIPDSDGVPAKFMCHVCRNGKVSGGPEMDSGGELIGMTVV